jgi:hypothetical protein
MITLKRSGSDLQLADRQHTLTLSGAGLAFDGLEINQPGEYESAGVEVIYGDQAMLLVWEKLQIVYIFQVGKISAFEKGQFAPCDVVIFSPQIEKLDGPVTNQLLEDYDPSVVVIAQAVTLDQALADTLKFQEGNQVKLASQTLPTEGRDFFLLS